jgi:predicted  nucleic acid-binding Zn-ribbon protein
MSKCILTYLFGLDKKIDKINKWRYEVMANLDDVKAAQVELLAAMDAEKVEVAEALTELKSANTDLQSQVTQLKDDIAKGGVVTAADLDDIVASLKADAEKIQGIYDKPAVQPSTPPVVESTVPVVDANGNPVVQPT